MKKKNGAPNKLSLRKFHFKYLLVRNIFSYIQTECCKIFRQIDTRKKRLLHNEAS